MVLAAVLTVLPMGGVVADTYGTGDPAGRKPDNHDHDWCWSTGWPGGTWNTDASGRHVNLEIQSGETVALTGSNGAGYSLRAFS